MSSGGRILRIDFASAEDFQREYEGNLVNGGVFVETDRDIELRQRVRVEIRLGFCGKRLVLQGEVVHRVTPEMARMGAKVGVAVQFDGPAHHVRAKLEPLRTATGTPAHAPKDPGRRKSPRMEARVPARIDVAGSELAGHTRDLSQTGVLVSVSGEGVAVGDKVRLALTDPASGQSREVDGIVVREVEGAGGVAAVGIEFLPEEGEREEMNRFVERIQSVEHTRRLGGINGEIAELGVENLLQMFASTGNAGTLTLRQGQEEGVIGFEQGMLRFVSLGATSSMKALVRLVGWKDGSFQYHAQLDPVAAPEPPLPFEAALFDAVRLLDESRRVETRRFPPEATPRMTSEMGEDTVTKVEAAVLDLVQAGFTVARIVEFIPEPDPEIYRALENLTDRGAIAF